MIRFNQELVLLRKGAQINMIIIKNGNVHLGNGEVLLNCDIMTEGKFIKKVGMNLECKNAQIIDASGKEVFPGFIDTMSAIGAMGLPSSYHDNCEATDTLTPEMNIRYSVDPDEISIQKFYLSGITSIGLSPANDNVMGGQIAVFKTPPFKYEQRYLKEKAALKCSVTNSVRDRYGKKDILPKTKMGIFNILENALHSVSIKKEDEYNEKETVIKQVLDGKMPVLIAANTKQEMESLIHLLKKYDNVKYYIADAFEYDRCVEALAQNAEGLILGNVTNLSATGRYKVDLSKVRVFIDNNKPVSFSTTAGGYSEGREVYIWNAIEMYKAGIEEEEIVKMMTLNPAKILGVDDLIGTIEEGKHADIVVYSKNPIKSYDARVEACIVNGRSVL